MLLELKMFSKKFKISCDKKIIFANTILYIPFPLIISLIFLPMERIVLSTTSIGVVSSVVLTGAEKTVKSSRVIF